MPMGSRELPCLALLQQEWALCGHLALVELARIKIESTWAVPRASSQKKIESVGALFFVFFRYDIMHTSSTHHRIDHNNYFSHVPVFLSIPV